MVPRLIVACAAALISSVSPSRAVLIPTLDPTRIAVAPAEEVARRAERARALAAGDYVAVMDASTPEELAEDFGFAKDQARVEAVAVSKALVRIDVNISTGLMNVVTPTGTLGPWKVSTAGPASTDAVGHFAIEPTRMYDFYRSREHKGAPMPKSMFYHEGYAIHATNSTKRLGRPASHGCVRLHPKNATLLFSIVQPIVEANGLGSATVHVHY